MQRLSGIQFLFDAFGDNDVCVNAHADGQYDACNAGKTLHSAISLGFDRAFSSVFDGNITVIIVSIVLLSLGSGSLLSFGYTLLWGVIMNFVAGVTASRLMISSLSEYKALQKPAYFGARRMEA